MKIIKNIFHSIFYYFYYIMTEYTFLGTYLPSIILVVVLIIGALVVFSTLGINFNTETQDVITHEKTYNTTI